MSRTINKPEDAIPLIANLFTDSGQMVPKAERVFTAAECAQIARAFEKVAIAMQTGGSEEEYDEYMEWEAKFREWEKKE